MKTVDARVAVGPARPGTGKGLFTLADIPAGEFIIEYTGKKISTAQADVLKTRYLFEIDDAWTLDAEGEENVARYVNHSCEPNCEAELKDGHVWFFAAHDISRGEELTIDYGEEYFDEFIRPVGCKCGAAKHRN